MKFSNNNSGFSLVEAMVGVAIISVMALTITRFSEVRNASKVSKLSTSCKSIAKSVIERVKDISVASQQSSYFLGTDGRAFYTLPYPFTDMSGRIDPAHTWIGATTLAANPGGEIPFWFLNGTNQEVNTYLLIESSIRALTSIYNSPGWANTARTLTDFNPYPPLTDNTANEYIGQITEEDPNNPPVITINVFPYNIINKTPALARTAPLFIKPKRGNNTTTGVTVTHAAEAEEDLGMRLIVQVNYNVATTNESCQASHDFQYPADNSPPVISFLEVTQNLYDGGPTSQSPNGARCNAPLDQGADVQIKLGVEPGSFEEGIIFLCRDTSAITTYGQAPSGTYGPYPVSANGLHPCTDGGTQPTHYSVGGGTPDTTGPTATTTTPSTGAWVPCHQVTLCGKAPASFTVNGFPGGSLERDGAPTTSAFLELNYTFAAAPTDPFCRYGMEAIAIDSAGNTSGLPTQLALPAASAFGTTDTSDSTFYRSNRGTVSGDGTIGALGPDLYTSRYFSPDSSIGKAPPHCSAKTLCTDPGGAAHGWHANWANAFPQGYYSCQTRDAGACCLTPVPPDGDNSVITNGTLSDDCHPYSL